MGDEGVYLDPPVLDEVETLLELLPGIADGAIDVDLASNHFA